MKREKSLKKVKIFEKRGEKSFAPQKKRPPSVEPLRSSRPQAKNWDVFLGAINWTPEGAGEDRPRENCAKFSKKKPSAEDDERQRRAEELDKSSFEPFFR